MPAIGATLSPERVPTKGRNPTQLGRSPQLSRRAASGHDGLKGPPTLPVNPHNRKATLCPAHVCPDRTSVMRFRINRDRDRLS
jgi:hypothetical protein